MMVSKKVLMTHLFVIPAKVGIHNFKFLQVPGLQLSRERQLFTNTSNINTILFTCLYFISRHCISLE